jgi:hypothetical protein
VNYLRGLYNSLKEMNRRQTKSFTAWKVIDCNRRSVVVSNVPGMSMKYSLNKWVKKEFMKGPLMAFYTKEQAERFVKNNLAGNKARVQLLDRLEHSLIVKAEVIEFNEAEEPKWSIKMISESDCSMTESWRACSWPKGTIFCEQIKCVE